MQSTLTTPSLKTSSFLPKTSPTKQPFSLINPKPKSKLTFTLKASTSNPFISHLKTTTTTAAAAIIFTAAFLKLQPPPATASVLPPPPTLTQQLSQENETQNQENTQNQETSQNLENSQSLKNSPLTQFLESNAESIEALKDLLQKKLEVGEDEEGLKILLKLTTAQPENNEWKFLMARLYNEMGKPEEARDVFEEILLQNPLLFEGLFENALLMDRCGEGEGVIRRLEEALRLAENEGKAKEARDVRLIIAQIHFLQKNVEEALRSYEELANEDPKDFRPYFCKGMIYSLLDKNQEAREQFAKYRELSPKKFEVEGYLRSPLSRMKLFGTEEEK